MMNAHVSSFLGRFAGNTWPVLAKYGKNLASLQLAFSESTSHHSWVLDHLLHVDSIIKTNKLEALSLIRTGKRNTLAPKLLAFSTTLPAGLLSTILEQGKCLKRLSIDFYEISLETLKLILDACPNLVSFDT